MKRYSRAFSHPGLAALAALAAALLLATPAYAQMTLIKASPTPDSTLANSPDSVTLTFNFVLSDEGSTAQVNDESGKRVDLDDAHVDPANRFNLIVSLPPLPEGHYTVAYSVTGLGSSVILSNGYQFNIQLPVPTLSMVAPVNGQAFEEGLIPLEMQVQYFPLDAPGNRILLYVDGTLTRRLHTLTYNITGLEPGVHEIKTVLARSGNQELPSTINTAYIAIAQPDVETRGRELAAIAPPDPGLQLSALQWIGVAGLTAILLAVGFVLGRSR